MSRNAQALQRRHIAKAALLILLAMPLCACGMGGFSLKKAEVDRSILTGDIKAESQAPTDAERFSDEMTIRNAVSSVDVEGISGALPWANTNTGSRGTITELVEHKEQGTVCRRFTTSRESFDGINLYKGEACLAGQGAWRMMAFQPL